MLILKNNNGLNTHSTTGSTTAFHLVDLSPWPFVASFSLFIMLSGAVLNFHGYNYGSLSICIGAFLLVSAASLWWRDVTREGFQGQHTGPVTKGIKMGFSLFIVSEIFLFIAFFWALFHSSLVPNIELGNVWPPLGIEPINPWVVPLLNAIILLSSGVTVTWAHHAIIACNYKSALYGLSATIILAFIFTALMVAEYYIASFDISDSVYGSCFYMLTGLHGSHIIVAIIFLLVSAYRLYKHHFSNLSFLGAELGILYYHFVDVVFLFVFGLVYWWSSGIELSFVSAQPHENIHAFAPLLFVKNSIYPYVKTVYKKLVGLQVIISYNCATTNSFWFAGMFFTFFALLDLNYVTVTLFWLFYYIFSLILLCFFGLKFKTTQSFLADASGYPLDILKAGITLAAIVRIGTAIIGGFGLYHGDQLVNDYSNITQLEKYNTLQKNLGYPADPEVQKHIMTRTSSIKDLVQSVGTIANLINKKPGTGMSTGL